MAAITPAAVNIVLTPYALHAFGTTKWGLFLLIQALSVFFGALNGGIPGSVGRFFAIYASRDDRDTTTKALCSLLILFALLGALISGLSWVLAPVFLDLFSINHSLRSGGLFLFRIVGPFVAVSLFSALLASLVQARQKYRLTSIATIITYLVYAGGVVLSVRSHFGLQGLGVTLLVQPAVSFLLLVPYTVRSLEFSSLGLLPKAEILELIRFGANVQLLQVSQLVNEQADSIIVGGVFRLTDLARFNIGANFAMQLRAILQSGFAPIATHLSQTYGRHGRQATKQVFEQVQTVWVVLLSGFMSSAVGAAYFAITAWLGRSFSTAGFIAVLFLVAIAINICTDPLAFYLSAVGHPQIQARFAIVSAALNISLTIPMLFAGVLGVGGATAIAAVAASFLFVADARRKTGEEIPHFLLEIPRVRCTLTIALTVGLELALRPVCPTGALGLLASGAPAIVSLAFYFLLTFRQDMDVVRRLITTRRIEGSDLFRALS